MKFINIVSKKEQIKISETKVNQLNENIQKYQSNIQGKKIMYIVNILTNFIELESNFTTLKSSISSFQKEKQNLQNKIQENEKELKKSGNL